MKNTMPLYRKCLKRVFFYLPWRIIICLLCAFSPLYNEQSIGVVMPFHRYKSTNPPPVRRKKRLKPINQHTTINNNSSNNITSNSAEQDREHKEYQQSLMVLTVARKWASVIDSLSENYLIYVGINGGEPSIFSCNCKLSKIRSIKPIRLYFFHGKLSIVYN